MINIWILAICLSFNLLNSDSIQQFYDNNNQDSIGLQRYHLGFAAPFSITFSPRLKIHQGWGDSSSFVKIATLPRVVRICRRTNLLRLNMVGSRKDYYAILGVDRKADDKEIKRAYKRLAMRNHPDVNKDPGAKVMSCY